MADELPQLLRSDARDNRDRVLEAARELFAEQGLGVPMREVARRAGVGPATLYRRFPTKQDLVDRAFTHELHACRAIVDDGCADPDPWQGFCRLLERISELNAANQGFVDAFSTTFPGAVDFSAHRGDMLRSINILLRRAKAAGALRRDVVLDDVVLVLLAVRRLSALPPERRVTASRRLAALALQSFRADGPATPLPPAPRLVRPVAR